MPAAFSSRPTIVDRIVEWRKLPFIGILFRQIALALAVDIPRSVKSGFDFRVMHRGKGIVLHPKTQIGSRVRIFHNVTVGRGDVRSGSTEKFGKIVISDDVWLCVGSVVLAKDEDIVVGKGTTLAANAVLLESTGEYEVWGGIPAKRLTPAQDS